MGQMILIADDAATIRCLIRFTLEAAGYRVEEAADGEEALEKMKNGLKPDLVITDLNMPKMDGLALVRSIRGLPEQRFTPILMLTTESQEKKKMEGKKAGATGWLMKPFTPEHLLQVVNIVMF